MPRYTDYERVEDYTDILGRKRRRIVLQNGTEVHFWDAVKGVESSFTSLNRWMRRVGKLASDEFEQEKVDRLVDRFIEMAAAREHGRKLREGWERRKQRIAAMRNTDGRDPAEIPLFQAQADKEERELLAEIRRYS